MKVSNAHNKSLKSTKFEAGSVEQKDNSKKTQKVAEGEQKLTKAQIQTNPLSPALKDINKNIGKLQILSNSLNSLESEIKKENSLLGKLQKNQGDETLLKELAFSRESIKNIIDNTSFDGENLFDTQILKDGSVIFDPKPIKEAISGDGDIIELIKNSKKDIKTNIDSLQKDAYKHIDLASKNATETNLDKQKLKGMKNAHDTSKLDPQRVNSLLA